MPQRAYSNIDMQSAVKILNLPDPSSAQDAATKHYVDNLVAGLSWKQEVAAATTGALAANTYANGSSGVGATLTANSNGAIAAIDGYSPAVTDRLLIKDEATGSHNGIYAVTQVGDGSHPYILTRVTDMDQSAEFDGAACFVANGSVNADHGFVCSNAGTVVVGTTAITFVTFSAGAGTVTSVGISGPSIITWSGTPITTSGTLSGTLASQSANTFLAAPNGSSGTPSFRLLVAADVPNLPASIITSGQLALARGGTNADLSATGGSHQVLMQTSSGANVSVAQLAFSDISGTASSGQLPGGFNGFANPTANVGLSVVNGSAVTAMRSDAAPALDVSISPTWTGTHTFNSHAIVASAGVTSLPTPVASSDATNKSYVDGLIQGVQWKPEVMAMTTAALAANTYSNGSSGVGATLTANSNGAIAAIDGYSPSVNDRLLIANEATASHNGIYSLTTVGDGSHPYVLTRVTDMDQSTEFSGGACFVVNGTVNSDQAFVCSNTGSVTVGTTSITFVQITGVADITAGSGLSKSGNTLSIATGGVTNAMLAGSIAASKLVGTDITTVGTIASGTWNGTTIAIANGGTGQTTANAALNALLPSQTGNSGKFLTTDGSNTSWASSSGGGGVSLGLVVAQVMGACGY